MHQTSRSVGAFAVCLNTSNALQWKLKSKSSFVFLCCHQTRITLPPDQKVFLPSLFREVKMTKDPHMPPNTGRWHIGEHDSLGVLYRLTERWVFPKCDPFYQQHLTSKRTAMENPFESKQLHDSWYKLQKCFHANMHKVVLVLTLQNPTKKVHSVWITCRWHLTEY